MEAKQALVDRIYDAAAFPETWAAVGQALADEVGGMGALIMQHKPMPMPWIVSPGIERLVADYVAEGWADDESYAAPLLADDHPGFRAEAHYRSPEETARMPMHRHFLEPRGLVGGVGTMIQGVADDCFQIAIEGFTSREQAFAASDILDLYRPHIARSLSLAARMAEVRERSVLDGLGMAQVGAAIADAGGRLRLSNDRFRRRLGSSWPLRSAQHAPLRHALARAIGDVAALRSPRPGGVQSLPVAMQDGSAPFVLHVMPLRGGAEEVFEHRGALLIIAETVNRHTPDSSLLKLLFDLTPAEAKLARSLAAGQTLTEAAAAGNITAGTARVHLRSIFSKTNVTRQTDLVRTLMQIAVPEAMA